MSVHEYARRLKQARRFKITHHLEEGECAECGCPLYVGDIVFVDPDDDWTYYCSRACAGAREA